MIPTLKALPLLAAALVADAMPAYLVPPLTWEEVKAARDKLDRDIKPLTREEIKAARDRYDRVDTSRPSFTLTPQTPGAITEKSKNE